MTAVVIPKAQTAARAEPLAGIGAASDAQLGRHRSITMSLAG